MSIRTRILAGFLLVVTVMAGLTAYALTQMRSANHGVRQLANEQFATYRSITDLQHLGDQAVTDATTLLYAPADKKGAALDSFKAGVPAYNAALTKLGTLPLDAKQRPVYQQVIELTSSLTKYANGAFAVNFSVPDPSAPIATLDQASGMLDKRTAAMAQLKDITSKALTANETNLNSSYNSSKRNVILLLVIIGLAAAAGAFWLAAKIVAPLRAAVDVLGKVADGDLTQRLDVSSKDEVGQMSTALNRTLESTESVISMISISAEELSAAANGLIARAKRSPAPPRRSPLR